MERSEIRGLHPHAQDPGLRCAPSGLRLLQAVGRRPHSPNTVPIASAFAAANGLIRRRPSIMAGSLAAAARPPAHARTRWFGSGGAAGVSPRLASAFPCSGLPPAPLPPRAFNPPSIPEPRHPPPPPNRKLLFIAHVVFG